jgi:hypothetical protein
MVALLLITFGLFTLLLAFWSFYGGSQVQNLSELEQHTKPIDLRVLASLVNPAQEQFVKRRLTRLQFFRYKIMKFLAASSYVACISRNSAVLLSVGRVAAKSSSLDIAATGRELVAAAFRVRMYAMLARASLAIQILFPTPFKSLNSLMHNYSIIKQHVSRLSNLEVAFQNVSVLRFL